MSRCGGCAPMVPTAMVEPSSRMATAVRGTPGSISPGGTFSDARLSIRQARASMPAVTRMLDDAGENTAPLAAAYIHTQKFHNVELNKEFIRRV